MSGLGSDKSLSPSRSPRTHLQHIPQYADMSGGQIWGDEHKDQRIRYLIFWIEISRLRLPNLLPPKSSAPSPPPKHNKCFPSCPLPPLKSAHIPILLVTFSLTSYLELSHLLQHPVRSRPDSCCWYLSRVGGKGEEGREVGHSHGNCTLLQLLC